MASKTVLIFTIVVLVAVVCQAAVFPYAQKPREKNCQCMPSKYCDGRINSDIQCHPSYIMVCCIRPEPETAPPYIPDHFKVHDDDVQVIQV